MDNGGNADNNGWNTEDELEIDNFVLSSSSSSGLGFAGDETTAGSGEVNSSTGSSSNSRTVDHFVAMGFSLEMVTRAIEENGQEKVDLILQSLLQESASSSAGPSCSKSSKLVDHFIGMGFSEKMVLKAIQENGEGNTDLILETLLTYTAIEKSPQADHVDSDHLSPEIDESFLEDFSDFDSISDTEDIANPDSNEGSRLLILKRMGYTKDEASIAIQRCGPESSIAELTDFICAAQLSKAADALLPPEEKPKLKRLSNDNHKNKKSRISGYNQMKQDRRLMNGDDDVLHLPNPMIGFGVPSDPDIITHRTLPEGAIGPPYFYYENVALAPKGVWQTISRFLFDVEPEFVDSKYFCAAARKRGYVHNLPIENRFPLVPPPPITVHQAFPLTKKWWPSWDNRTKMNCLQTVTASAKLTDRIRKALEEYPDGDPPKSVQRWVLDECRKWNLVWVGRNKVAPLEPDEVEMLLGFPRNHTRGGGSSRTERYKSLGNSFQVDTVAYHLSVLKDMYPRGINMLSLFSGIGGAEVALHRLGITMKNVVSVEISEVNRNVVRSWWDQTQKGKLIHINDVQELNADRLEKLMSDFGGFDLVVGGSPCNNLAGSNRVHRTGLEGKESSLFFDYCRILDLVRCIMGRA